MKTAFAFFIVKMQKRSLNCIGCRRELFKRFCIFKMQNAKAVLIQCGIYGGNLSQNAKAV